MAEKTNLTPLTAQVLIPRKNGDGFYVEGDRVIARDLAGGNVERTGTVGMTGSDGKGKDYMVIRYGDDPFLEAFIATVSDIVEDLPDDNIEAIEAWLEEGK